MPRSVSLSFELLQSFVSLIRHEGEAARARGDTGFSVRVAVNSGPAIVGNVGTARRYNYTAVGETVNVAARLESVPAMYGCQLVIGPCTADLAKDEFLLRELDRIQVKGGRGPISIFEPLCERSTATPADLDRAARFADALARYRAMQFADASAIWAALAREERGTGDPVEGKPELQSPPAVMAARAIDFALHPPEEPWDGVRVLATK